VGSPTALADADVEARLRAAVARGPYGVYVPVGALWGARDLERLAASGGLTALTVTMKKAPHHFRLTPPLSTSLAAVDPATPGETVLYEGMRPHRPPTPPSSPAPSELTHRLGPVRALCPLAPNNVNTMAAAALVAAGLGFDGVVARLVTDPRCDAAFVRVGSMADTDWESAWNST
jgi:aspartate dehydrogenase